jgi:23S rRNA (guanosine2251-2'-O)-methyltransferase
MSKPLSAAQAKHLNQQLLQQSQVDLTRQICIVLQDVNDPVNIGSIFRTADGCQASLMLTGTTPTPPNPQISLAARGLERHVPWEYAADFAEVVAYLKGQGFTVVGVELTPDAVDFAQFKPDNDKIALVLGNEALGIYKKNIPFIDSFIFIPMLGKGPSLNVNVAAAIAAYALRTSST